MSGKGKRIVALIIIVATIIIGLLIFEFDSMRDKNFTTKPEITSSAEPTEQVYVTSAPTESIVPTCTPIFVVVVTSTPDPTSVPVAEPTADPTPVPTAEPTLEPTPEPTSTPTSVPTTEPTATPTSVPTTEPTATPAAEPTTEFTAEPTAAPTPVPTTESTAEPTAVTTSIPTLEPTAEPTSVPTAETTPEPTQDVSGEENLQRLIKEMSSLTIGGGIYIDYDIAPTYDLYNYISLDGVDTFSVWNAVKQPFLDGIANWIDMSFDASGNTLNRLSEALNASICQNCGRIRIGDHPENSEALKVLFDEIERNGEYQEATEILLNFLHDCTVKSPDNSNERLIIACQE